MILRLFLSNQPLVLVLLAPLIALFHILNAVFNYHKYLHIIDLGLWGKAALSDTLWLAIPTGVIVSLNALLLNRLFNKHEFLERYNYGPSLFYVLLMSFSHSFYQLDGVLLVHTCFLLSLWLLFEIRPNEDSRKVIFNSFFFVGLAATFLPASAGMLIFFWFAVWSLKGFVGREWLISLIGFLIPVVNALTYWWFSGHQISLNVLRNNVWIKQETMVYYASSAAVLTLLVLSVIGVQIRLQKSSIRFKKLSRALVWVLIGTALLGVFSLLFYQQVEWFSTMFIPLSFFFTFAFIHKFWQVVATWFFYTTLGLAVIKFFLTSIPYL
jgi:hypothetical protein